MHTHKKAPTTMLAGVTATTTKATTANNQRSGDGKKKDKNQSEWHGMRYTLTK